MAIINKRDLFEYLQTSKKFCRQVDKYITLLGLDEEEVQNYKYSCRLFMNMNSSQIDDAWDEKMARSRLENLHLYFVHLIHKCKNSSSYSMSIGIDLGIERGMLVASN